MGIQQVVLASQKKPVLRVTTNAGGSGTETIPFGYNNLTIEVWAPGGGGTDGSGVGCAAISGSKGGAGGYSRSVVNVTAKGGQTIAWTIGTPGAHGSVPAGNGTASSVSSGTFSLATMTANAGHGATGTSGSGLGTGGTATGGTAANTTGGTGDSVGTSGTVSGDGSPYGGGGHQGAIGAGNPGGDGSQGAVVFYYTI